MRFAKVYKVLFWLFILLMIVAAIKTVKTNRSAKPESVILKKPQGSKVSRLESAKILPDLERHKLQPSRSANFRCAYASLLVRYFGDSAEIAHRVMVAESSCDPTKIHYERDGSISYGLFQLNNRGVAKVMGLSEPEILNPETNIRATAEYVSKYGWEAWSTFKRAEK